MKTSNIILLVILICLPVFSFTYNWLLKQQYLEGKVRFYVEGHTIQQNLPSFQHIWLDANLSAKDGSDEPIRLSWPWHVRCDATRQIAQIRYPKAWKDIMKARVENDTLFLSFETDKMGRNSYIQLSRTFGAAMLELSVPPIQSFTIQNGTCKFEAVNTMHAVKLVASQKANLYINNTQLEKIEIYVSNLASIQFEDNNRINNLEYALYDQAFLSISDQTTIDQWQLVHTDSLSRITLTAKATELQKHLVKVVDESGK